MKKSVILLIFIIYIASIMIVGFYGIKVRVYDEKVMVEDIVCENLTEFNGIDCASSDKEAHKKLYNEGIHYYAFERYKSEYEQNGFVFVVKFAVTPANATNKGVEYVIDESQSSKYTIVDNKNGSATITVYKKCTVLFSVRPMDKASDAMKNVKIDFIKY